MCNVRFDEGPGSLKLNRNYMSEMSKCNNGVSLSLHNNTALHSKVTKGKAIPLSQQVHNARPKSHLTLLLNCDQPIHLMVTCWEEQ